MKKITVIALLLAAALGAQARNGSGKPAYKDAGRPVEERVSDLLSRMTLEEKVMQLNQYTLGRNDNANNVADPVDKIPAEIGSLIYFDTSPGLRNRLQKKAIEQSRLGIPVLFGYDVIHGFRTTYPISLAQACSWNPALVKQAAEVAQTGKPLVLVLSSGRPLELCRLEPLCGAMVQMWQPGIRGGNPLAGILSGRINPSGRLAMTFPRSTGQIPIYYNRRQSGRTHQGKYQDIPSTPLYEFGHGLSYTTFEYGDLRPSATTLRRGEKTTVEVSVTNTGDMDGAETVHWFISDPVCRISRPVRELKHFEKQPIRRGETRTFRFEIDPEKDLSFTDDDGNRFLEPGDYFILVKDKKVKLTLTD